MLSHAFAAQSPGAAGVGDGGASPQGALLGSGAVIVWNDVTDDGRERFYRWHDNEHIPERLALPGFRRGRRFICAGHSPEWLTIYEAVDLGALTSPEYLARLNAPTPGTTSALRHFRNTSRAVCRLQYATGTSTGGQMLALRLSVPGESSERMLRTARDDLIPRAMSLTGVLACHLFAADQAASFVDTAESSTRAFDVPSWVLLCEASHHAAAEHARNIIDGPEMHDIGVAIRPDAAIYALEICRLATDCRQYAPARP